MTHAQTDFLAAYPDESRRLDAEQERRFLQSRASSANAVFLLASVGGKIAGTAELQPVGDIAKLRHRAELGTAVEKAYWGLLGIDRALLEACIECARTAGYTQLELDVVADSEKAVSLYKKVGFTEYGRNPKGFLTRASEFQELILMRLEL